MVKRVETHDTRIVYGFHCSWWGGIEEVGRHHSGTPNLPGCPVCGNGLFEVESPEEWWRMVDAMDKKVPGYKAFISWLRGKCFYGSNSEGFRRALKAYNEGEAKGRVKVVLP